MGKITLRLFCACFLIGSLPSVIFATYVKDENVFSSHSPISKLNLSINAPDAISVSMDMGQCYATGVNLGSPEVTGEGQITNNAPAQFPIGETVVIWIISHDGETATDIQIIEVLDDQKPKITAPDDLNLEVGDNCTISEVALGTPITTDNCEIETISTNAPEFFEIGETNIIWQVVDRAGNVATATQKVIVQDLTPPSLPNLENITWGCEYTVDTPEAFDNCDGQIIGIPNRSTTFSSSGNIEWTFSDEAGNTSTASQQITISPMQVQFDYSELICKESNHGYISAEISGGVSPYSYSWNTGDENPDLENLEAGTYELIITDANDCEILESVTIGAFPEPIIEKPANIEVCNGENISEIIFEGNSIEGKKYRWENDNSQIGIPSEGTGNINSFEAINSTNISVEANITVTPIANNCEGESEIFTIIVHPTPSFEKPENISICDGGEVAGIQFLNASVENTEFRWENDNPEIGLAASGNRNLPDFSAINSGISPQYATITVMPIANNCEGISETFQIEVLPNPELISTPEIPEFCNGQNTEPISFEANFEEVRFDIIGGAEIGLNNKTNVREIPSFNAVNNSNAPITKTITVIPKANGCTGESVEIEITVNPTPGISASPSNQQICSGEEAVISISGNVENASYRWEISNLPSGIEGPEAGGLTSEEIANGENKIIQALINSSNTPLEVTYSIRPLYAECEGSAIPVKVTINPIPQIEITNPEPVCSPATVDLTSSEITVGSTNGLNFSYWEDEEASIPLENPENAPAGDFFIKGETAAGCYTIKQVRVEENQTPELTSSLNPEGFCSGSGFYYEFTSNVEGTTYSWRRENISGISTPGNADEGNVDEVLVNGTNNPIEVIYEVTLISPEGCTNTQIITTTVTPTPQLNSTLNPEGICSETPFNYIPTSETGGTQYSWSRAAIQGIENAPASGTGEINETLINTTNNPIGVTYFYSLSSNNCENPEKFQVTVIVTPSPDTQVSVALSGQEPAENDIEICPGESIDLFSSVTLPTEETLPETLLEADFNSENQGWTTQQQNNNRRWRRVDNNHIAFETECEWWQEIYLGCENQTNYFSSNDNSSFFLVSSHEYNGNFNNVGLISPSFSTVGYNNLELSFWHNYRDRRSGQDQGYLEFSINNGNWQQVDNYTSTEGSHNNFINRNYNLNQIIGYENVRLRFRYTGANDHWFWAIDNIELTGDGKGSPDLVWTNNVDDWTSTEQNPENLAPVETTIYTATYLDPETGCPGSDSVTVIVKDPPDPEIIADYCAFEESNKILLSSTQIYDRYEWSANGEIISDEAFIEVNLAQSFSLRVWENGCEASTSITTSENLVQNGDFEAGNINFQTVYNYVSPGGNLYPEGYYAVDDNARDYHNDFFGNGHGGRGNFMIVNGDPSQGSVVWQTGTLSIEPDTDYYFNAWTMNLVGREEARLRLIITLPGQSNPVAESNLGDLTNVPVGEWIQFYNPEVWNSGDNQEVVLKIINENPVRDGNDFGIDDISFAALRPVDYEFNPSNNSPICEGDNLTLEANLEGGREPITFSWSGPNGFSSSEANPVLEEVTSENAGEYELTITDFYGCDIPSETTSVIIIEKPVVFAGDDFEICSSNPVINLDQASITSSTNSGSWTNVDGETTGFENPNVINTVYQPSDEEIENGEVRLILTSDSDEDEICENVQDEIVISINNSPQIDNFEIVNVACFDTSTGEAGLQISGGTPPFTYAWDNGQTGEIATGLSAGEYSVTVTDSKGCSVTEAFEIKEPPALEIIDTEFAEPSCFGASDANALIEVSGGFLEGVTAAYSFVLLDDNDQEIASEEGVSDSIWTVNNLKAGNYTFLFFTENNCSIVSTSVNITQPEAIAINAGENINIVECGATSVKLNAEAVNAEIGEGSWTVISGENGTFSDAGASNSEFYGNPDTDYTLRWTISENNECDPIFDEIEVSFPPACSTLDFDGEDDFVVLDEDYNFNSNFSIETWVKPHIARGTEVIFGKMDGSSGYELALNNGKVSFSINNMSVTSNQSIDESRWYHLAGVLEAGEMSLYVDGVLINSREINNYPANNNIPATVGGNYYSENPNKPLAPFQGWIEELRIWNTALSQNQLQFMMNQRIENNSGAVKGEVLPMNVPENLNWEDLTGYFQLKAKEAENGETKNLADLNRPGILKNMQTSQDNTAPLPYVLYADGNKDWYEKDTWTLPANLNGINISQRNVWEAPNSIGIDNTTKIDWNIVQLDKDVKNPGTPNNKNSISLLGLIQNEGKMDMMGENNFSGNALNISAYLKLNGFIDLNGESQLIQSSGSLIDENSEGKIERDQQGTKNSFNYNYWSSPVSSSISNEGFQISAVLRDGTNPREPQPISFGNPHTHADANYSGNLRISNYWLNIFHGTANTYGEWRSIHANTSLPTGTGFTMKGTSGSARINDEQNYIFAGLPNNGDIILEISEQENRLIGNPYPSALDVSEFMKDNLKDIPGGRRNRNVFNGAIYLWDHFGEENTHVLREYVGGYATYNLAGGVPGVSNDRRINSNGRGGSKTPGRWLPVGQGFFVNTVLDEEVSDFATVSGGELHFKNNQRIYERENPGRSIFMIAENNTKTKKGTENNSDSRFKIRLKFHSPEGYIRQLLVTADANTSNDFDLGYDAPLIDNNAEDMFWLINEKEFVIQGVPNFNIDQVLPLGIKIRTEKEFSISIDSLENFPNNLPVYLNDKETDSIHNLKENNYKAVATTGEVSDRFEIVFFKKKEKKEKPIPENSEENLSIYYYSDLKQVHIANPEKLEIIQVLFYDLQGRLIYTYKNLPIETDHYLEPPLFAQHKIHIIKVVTYDKSKTRLLIIK